MLRSALACLIMLAFPLPIAAADVVTIRSAVASLSQGRTLLVGGDPICASRPLPLFYTRRQFAPAWSERDRVDLLAAINDAGADGLREGKARASQAHVAASRRNPKPAAEEVLHERRCSP